ncbi:MAG TPA: protein translocase subunit SecF, partial [Pseudomonas sp.]|nr:protein translocase subunit SecF [Pseudomonas sp.]
MKRVINFMGVRHVAFALTVVLTLVSLASLTVKGLNFGLDFTGGTLIELSYEQPVALDQVRSQLAG